MSPRPIAVGLAVLVALSCAGPSAQPAATSATPHATASATSSATPTAQPAAGSIPDAIAQIDPARLEAHMKALAAFGSRAAGTTGHERARQYILDQLKGLPGLQTGLFTTKEPGVLTSVIVTVNPLEPPPPPFVGGFLIAHYDSSASDTPGWKAASDPAPGADEDATGVAALLEYARILSADRGLVKLPIVLAFFDGRYNALGGSSRYAQQSKTNQTVKWVIELDSIGFNPLKDRLDLVSYDQHSKKLGDRIRQANDKYAIGLGPVVEQMATTENAIFDAASFGLYVVPAALLTERYGPPDETYPGNPARRTVNDTPEKVTNKSLWLKVSKLALATALELAGGSPL